MEEATVHSAAPLAGREAVAAWIASGESMRDFAEQAKISFWSLKRWRLEFGPEFGLQIRRRPVARKANADQRVTGQGQTGQRIKLTPISIKADEPIDAGNTVQVRLRGQRTIVVHAAIDPQCLSRLISTVEQTP